MCGIVGYVSEREPDELAARLPAACAGMAHRGPDGQGVWIESETGLGHRRLSIIDLESGAQPMRSASGRLWITFNGEIYNYRALRTELASRGERFLTSSDTEVILAAYSAWGAEAPKRLNGIFSFAIWDRETRTLFCARDHLGVKPFLYAVLPGGRFVFGSEIKAILALGAFAAEIDPKAVTEYLAAGYPHGSRTLIRQIRRLAPGHSLTCRAGEVTIGRYWDLASAFLSARLRGGPAELTEAFRAQFDKSVAAQLVSDVPLGGFLSGGLDSASVVAAMKLVSGKSPLTFSLGFPEPTFSELEHANAAAQAIGTVHFARAPQLDLARELPALAALFDEPLGDTSIIPTHLVARVAREHVKVALSGDGADECLAGYDTYAADKLQRWLGILPGFVHRRLLRPLSGLIPHTSRKVGIDYKLRQFFKWSAEAPQLAHFGWRELFDRDERSALGGDPSHDPIAECAAVFREVEGADVLDQLLYADIKTWLAEDILTKVDRATMAVGLEARVPFLDPDLVGFCARLPTEMKMSGFERKRILRAAMTGRLPASIIQRRKSGFNAPVSHWLRGPLRGIFEDLSARTALVDSAHPLMRSLWREHLGERRDHGFKLWALLALFLWENHVLKAAARAATASAPIESLA